MNNRAGRQEGPENVDQAFAEIVADLRREGLGTEWSDRPGVDGRADDPVTATTPMTVPFEVIGPAEQPVGVVDEEHYVPPEPPPLPPLRKPTILALLLIVIGLFLLIAPGLIGIGTAVAMPVALIAIGGGIGTLILHVRNGPPADGWDDGARL